MKNATFEIHKENTTGEICKEAGTYICNTHIYIEKYLSIGDRFPKCDQKNIPHNTSWSRIIQEHDEK